MHPARKSPDVALAVDFGRQVHQERMVLKDREAGVGVNQLVIEFESLHQPLSIAESNAVRAYDGLRVPPKV